MQDDINSVLLTVSAPWCRSGVGPGSLILNEELGAATRSLEITLGVAPRSESWMIINWDWEWDALTGLTTWLLSLARSWCSEVCVGRSLHQENQTHSWNQIYHIMLLSNIIKRILTSPQNPSCYFRSRKKMIIFFLRKHFSLTFLEYIFSTMTRRDGWL